MNINKYIIFLALLVPTAGFCADLHVGSGQTYATVASAISASSSGDNVVIHEGTYLEYRLTPNSGTTIISAARFDPDSYGSEAVPVVDAQQTVFQSGYDTFVLYPARTNVTIEGLHIKDGSRNGIRVTDSGGSNITIQYNTIEMTGWTSYATDNAACIYIEPNDTSSGVIQNNVLISSIAGVHGINGYKGSGDWAITNNTIYISGDGGGGKGSHGIFWKHGGTGASQMLVRNNVVWASGYSDNGGIWIVNDNVLIDNNLMVASSESKYQLTIGGAMGVTGGDDCVVTNNTAYGGSRSGLKMESGYYPEDTIWRNNIIVKTTSATEYRALNFWVYGSGTHNATEEYNLVYQSGQTTPFKRYSTAYNLATWGALDTSYGTGTVSDSPVFLNSSGTMLEIADFALASSSAGYQSGSDGLDMGADISLVGASITAPSGTVGWCGSEAAQVDTRSYPCTVGTSSNQVDGTTTTTWDCVGTESTDSCSAAYSETVTPTGTITAYSLPDGSVIPYKLTTE